MSPFGGRSGSTSTRTRAAMPVSEAPIAPKTPVQEVAAPDNTCPYISNDAARAAEGDRVGRVMLTTSTPPGCNFYWQYDDARMILEISVTNYPTQTGAYPIVLATYEIVCSKYPDADTGTAVKAFLQTAIGAGQNGLSDNGYIPIPAEFLPKLTAAVNAIA